jgi:hypothetical protein
VLELSRLQLREVVLELRPFLLEARDFLLELRLRRGGLPVPALGLAAPIDQLVQGFVQTLNQSAAVIAAQHLTDLGIESRLQGGARVGGHVWQYERPALPYPEQAEDANRLGSAAAAGAPVAEQSLERLFGHLAVQMPAIR